MDNQNWGHLFFEICCYYIFSLLLAWCLELHRGLAWRILEDRIWHWPACTKRNPRVSALNTIWRALHCHCRYSPGKLRQNCWPLAATISQSLCSIRKRLVFYAHRHQQVNIDVDIEFQRLDIRGVHRSFPYKK